MKHLFALLAATAVMLTACDPKNSPASTGTGATAAPAPAPAPSRETARGTVDLLIQAMRDGNYEAALLLVDETCEGFQEIQGAEEAINTARNNPNAGEALVSMYYTLFTRAWQTARVELLGEREGMARFRILFDKAAPIEVDVRNGTGQWLVICGQNIFVLEREGDPEEAPATGG